VLLARLEITQPAASAKKPEVKKAAENSPSPVKHEIAAIVAPARPVEETKPAPVPLAKSDSVMAMQQPPAPVLALAPAPAPVKTALDQLKLQAIFYNSQHPSALINGQLAGVDEEVAKCRVLSISPSSVTFEYLHQRKTLTLR
jgi:hypothetical protein